jgi:hypothetical protein
MLVDGLPITSILVGWQGNGVLYSALLYSASASLAWSVLSVLSKSLTHRMA